MLIFGPKLKGRTTLLPSTATFVDDNVLQAALSAAELMTRRPKHLHLLKIRQPVTAIVSVLHRISGALLFLFVPFLLWLWQLSLTSEETFASFRQTLSHPLPKLVVLVLAWAYLHHFFAGVRYLFIDLNYGVELASARATSKWVLGVSLVLTVLFAMALW
jgi:succinate dehydrogenase / fumarate reductase cytochrome b subunit